METKRILMPLAERTVEYVVRPAMPGWWRGEATIDGKPMRFMLPERVVEAWADKAGVRAP